MDKVRFGRALGYGARHTAKALYKAVDAARAPATEVARQPPRVSPAAAAKDPEHRSTTAANRSATIADRSPKASVVQGSRGAAKSAKALGRSVWTPVARFSGVLWLQVTGSVYAVIALAMGQAVWLRRADLHLSPRSNGAQRAYLLLSIFALFAYFAISSFVRAARMEKR